MYDFSVLLNKFCVKIFFRECKKMLSETALLKLRTKTVKVFSNDTVDSCCVSPTSAGTPIATTSIRNIDSSFEINSKPCLLLSLPISVIVQMMAYLSACELLKLSATCSTLRTLVLSSWELWRNLLRNQQNLSLFNYKVIYFLSIGTRFCQLKIRFRQTLFELCLL